MIQRGDGEMVGPKPLTGNEIQTVMDRLTFNSSRNKPSILTEKKAAYLCVGSVGFKFYKITPFINMYTKISPIK